MYISWSYIFSLNRKGSDKCIYTTHSIPVTSWAIALLGLLLHIPICTTEHLPLFFKNPFMTMYNLCLPLYVCITIMLKQIIDNPL